MSLAVRRQTQPRLGLEQCQCLHRSVGEDATNVEGYPDTDRFLARFLTGLDGCSRFLVNDPCCGVFARMGEIAHRARPGRPYRTRGAPLASGRR